MTEMFEYVNPRNGQYAPLIADDVYKVIQDNAEFLDSHIIYNRDFNYDYFGFKTLERSYLLKINGKIVERPQHMLMRVSVGIHLDDLESVLETYDLMSKKFFT
jgi:ribonucleoside-diphosphate reductase alpha chain